jgi:hypothetical protein
MCLQFRQWSRHEHGPHIPFEAYVHSNFKIVVIGGDGVAKGMAATMTAKCMQSSLCNSTCLLALKSCETVYVWCPLNLDIKNNIWLS